MGQWPESRSPRQRAERDWNRVCVCVCGMGGELVSWVVIVGMVVGFGGGGVTRAAVAFD